MGGCKLSEHFLPDDNDKSSGRLQIFEPKDFPFLHTGHSLVFTIARNGHVWGKRLDRESAKGDVELEVYWPVEEGCLVSFRHPTRLGGIEVNKLGDAKAAKLFSVEQTRKIDSILSQKEKIRYELGTLMVWPWSGRPDSTPTINYWRAESSKQPGLLRFGKEPCDIQVINCSYAGNEWLTSPNLSAWHFKYNDNEVRFVFYANSKLLNYGTPEHPLEMERMMSNFVLEFDNGAEKVVKRYFASRLSDRKFDLTALHSEVTIRKELRIMYGEYNFFEYFDIDDAFLFLEAETTTAGSTKLFWTLGIAQNRVVREMMRLASNNPDLFKPALGNQMNKFGSQLDKFRSEFRRHDHVYPSGEARVE